MLGKTTRRRYASRDDGDRTARFEHSCVGLARQLGGRAGIQRVDVDERTNRATITYDDTRLTASHVRHLIAQCGYEVRDTAVQDDASGVRGNPAGRA